MSTSSTVTNRPFVCKKTPFSRAIERRQFAENPISSRSAHFSPFQDFQECTFLYCWKVRERVTEILYFKPFGKVFGYKNMTRTIGQEKRILRHRWSSVFVRVLNGGKECKENTDESRAIFLLLYFSYRVIKPDKFEGDAMHQSAMLSQPQRSCNIFPSHAFMRETITGMTQHWGLVAFFYGIV